MAATRDDLEGHATIARLVSVGALHRVQPAPRGRVPPAAAADPELLALTARPAGRAARSTPTRASGANGSRLRRCAMIVHAVPGWHRRNGSRRGAWACRTRSRPT